MKYIIAILLFASCNKKQQHEIVVDHVDSLLQNSITRTDTIETLIPKVDHVIHVKEQKNAADLRAFKILRDSARVVKTIVIHDTIVIKEKTNFWGRKRTTTDSMKSIDSTEYEKDF